MRIEKRTIKEKEFSHKGLKCVILFVRQSHRCGYVRIPKDNPAFELEYNDVPVYIHGGLTFGDYSLLPGYKKNKNFYWFGFDCSHAGDKTAPIIGMSGEWNGHFWTKKDVIKETKELAEQLKKISWENIMKRKLEYEPEWFRKHLRLEK